MTVYVVGPPAGTSRRLAVGVFEVSDANLDLVSSGVLKADTPVEVHVPAPGRYVIRGFIPPGEQISTVLEVDGAVDETRILDLRHAATATQPAPDSSGWMAAWRPGPEGLSFEPVEAGVLDASDSGLTIGLASADGENVILQWATEQDGSRCAAAPAGTPVLLADGRRLEPASDEAHLLLSFLDRGDLTHAAVMAEPALRSMPQDATLAVAAGYFLLGTGDRRLPAWVDELVNLWPRSFDAHLLNGWAYLYRDDAWQRAGSALRDAIRCGLPVAARGLRLLDDALRRIATVKGQAPDVVRARFLPYLRAVDEPGLTTFRGWPDTPEVQRVAADPPPHARVWSTTGGRLRIAELATEPTLQQRHARTSAVQGIVDVDPVATVAEAEGDLEDEPGIISDLLRALLDEAEWNIARYRRTGRSSGPPSPPDLDAAVSTLDDALSVARSGHRWRSRIEQNLARLLMIRYVAHGGTGADRDHAIALFRAVAGRDDLAPGDAEVARLALAILLILRMYPTALAGGPAPNFGTILADFNRQKLGEARDDLDYAVDNLHSAIASGRLPAELDRMAPTLLASAMLLRGLFTDAGLDRGAIIGQLTRALVSTTANAPARAEIGGLRAWLVADSIGLPASDESTSDGVVVAEAALTASLAELPAGDDMRPALLRELAIVTAARLEGTSAGSDFVVVEQLLQQALREMPDDYPLRADIQARLAGAAISSAAYLPSTDGVDRAVALAMAVLEVTEADGSATGSDHLLVAMALLLRGYRDSDDADVATAVGHLRTALASMAPDDALVPTAVSTLVAVLNDRHLRHGTFEDVDGARFYLTMADGALTAVGPADALSIATMRGLRGLAGAAIAIRVGDTDRLAKAAEDMRAALAAFPPSYPWRSRPYAALGMAHLVLGVRRADTAEIRRGIAVVDEALAAGGDPAGRAGLQALGGLGALLAAQLGAAAGEAFTADEDRGIELLRRAADDGGFGPDQRAALSSALGEALLLRADRTSAEADLDEAIAVLNRAQNVASRHGLVHALTLRVLALAYRRRSGSDDRRRAVDTGLTGLRAYAGEVFLQTGGEHAVDAARGAADAAAVVAGWCLADGRLAAAVDAIELGRELMLHAVTAATTVSEMLREDGHEDLAEEWDDTPSPVLDWTQVNSLAAAALQAGRPPDDVRLRVLDALRAGERLNRLTSPPSITASAAALRSIGADALAYLLPADANRPGGLLVVESTGTVYQIPAPQLRLDPDGPVAVLADTQHPASDGNAGSAANWAGALDAVCDWAWPAAIAPLLAHLRRTGTTPGHVNRVVLVPMGATGCVPWHAARIMSPSGHRYACHDLVISYAASARQLLDVVARDQLPVGRDPVFVANPLGDEEGAAFKMSALRMIFYRRSIGYGHIGERDDGPGTPDEVLTHLPGRGSPGASLLQLSCHAHASTDPARSHLRLLDAASGTPAPLPVGRILRQAHGRSTQAPGGLVVLSACTSDLGVHDYDEAFTLATAFIAAGAVGVVGTRWAVSDRLTAPLLFMFHRFLAGSGMSPAEALRATQVWLLDSRREYPVTLPDVFRGDFASHDFTATAVWAAFAHQGR